MNISSSTFGQLGDNKSSHIYIVCTNGKNLIRKFKANWKRSNIQRANSLNTQPSPIDLQIQENRHLYLHAYLQPYIFDYFAPTMPTATTTQPQQSYSHEQCIRIYDVATIATIALTSARCTTNLCVCIQYICMYVCISAIVKDLRNCTAKCVKSFVFHSPHLHVRGYANKWWMRACAPGVVWVQASQAKILYTKKKRTSKTHYHHTESYIGHV